ncbi:MAG TPA: hypothetical protein VIL49_06025 [Capillimicrobium sp.]|jgi:hypothetical protein
MEAALAFQIPLSAGVRFVGDHVVLDKFEVSDETAVGLLRESDDPGAMLVDMIEIGARVLDREHTGANVEFVRNELEKVGRDMDRDFSDKARTVAEFFAKKVDEVFSDQGTLTRALERHFSEDSSSAVQHQVRAVIAEVSQRSREDLVRQFSTADGSNPLAGFQAAALHSIKTAADQQHAHLREMNSTIVALRTELASLRAEKDKREEVAAVEERGAAKGRTYEEAVFEAIDAIARGRGDDCDAVGDVSGDGAGRKGDVVAAIDACAGPPRGRIVFEAKDRKLSKNAAIEELEGALQARGADFAVLVVPSEDELPARTHPLREYNGDKLFVVYDPDDGSRLALEVAYGLARARVLMARDEAGGLDAVAARGEVERALQAMEDVRRIKLQLTNATNGIEQARSLVDAMAANVRTHLQALDALLSADASVDALA